MVTPENAFLLLVVCALALFAGVLGWASWDEGRRVRRGAK